MRSAHAPRPLSRDLNSFSIAGPEFLFVPEDVACGYCLGVSPSDMPSNIAFRYRLQIPPPGVACTSAATPTGDTSNTGAAPKTGATPNTGTVTDTGTVPYIDTMPDSGIWQSLVLCQTPASRQTGISQTQPSMNLETITVIANNDTECRWQTQRR